MFPNVVSLLWATLVVCLDGKALVDARFVANEMRNHFIKCLKDTHLYLFSTLAKAVDVSSNKPKLFLS